MDFKTQKIDKYIFVDCGENLTGARAADIQKFAEDLLKTVDDGLVLELSALKQIDSTFFKSIAVIGKMYRSERKKFLGLTANPSIAKAIKQNGLDSSIHLVDDRSDIIPAESSAGSKLDVQFVNPFVECTLMTLKTQCNMQATPGKPFLKGAQDIPRIDIAGVIGLTSSAFNGSIALCFPEKTFLSAMEGMLDEKFAEITKDLEDGAGELLNIIFGQSKIILNDRGYGISKAIPTVIRGQDISVSHQTASPSMILPFETPGGPFVIEVVIDGLAIKN